MAEKTQGHATGTIVLRGVEESDLPTIFEHQMDPVAHHMAAFNPRERDAFMVHWRKIIADAMVFKQTILYDEQVAGNIVSFERDGVREIGYWIGREFWGRGIATRALTRFLEISKTRPLHAYVVRDNVASIRVLEKCGFIVCGVSTSFSSARGHQVEDLVLILT